MWGARVFDPVCLRVPVDPVPRPIGADLSKVAGKLITKIEPPIHDIFKLHINNNKSPSKKSKDLEWEVHGDDLAEYVDVSQVTLLGDVKFPRSIKRALGHLISLDLLKKYMQGGIKPRSPGGGDAKEIDGFLQDAWNAQGKPVKTTRESPDDGDDEPDSAEDAAGRLDGKPAADELQVVGDGKMMNNKSHDGETSAAFGLRDDARVGGAEMGETDAVTRGGFQDEHGGNKERAGGVHVLASRTSSCDAGSCGLGGATDGSTDAPGVTADPALPGDVPYKANSQEIKLELPHSGPVCSHVGATTRQRALSAGSAGVQVHRAKWGPGGRPLEPKIEQDELTNTTKSSSSNKRFKEGAAVGAGAAKGDVRGAAEARGGPVDASGPPPTAVGGPVADEEQESMAVDDDEVAREEAYLFVAEHLGRLGADDVYWRLRSVVDEGLYEAGDIVLEHVRRITADVSDVNLSDEHLSFLGGVSLECAVAMLKDRRALHASLVTMSAAVALAGTFQPADDPAHPAGGKLAAREKKRLVKLAQNVFLDGFARSQINPSDMISSLLGLGKAGQVRAARRHLEPYVEVRLTSMGLAATEVTVGYTLTALLETVQPVALLELTDDYDAFNARVRLAYADGLVRAEEERVAAEEQATRPIDEGWLDAPMPRRSGGRGKGRGASPAAKGGEVADSGDRGKLGRPRETPPPPAAAPFAPQPASAFEPPRVEGKSEPPAPS